MTPEVSIGMPVYNGERFLHLAVDSLLAQTSPDFELIISDNGSTDATEEICRDYSRRDRRVKYIRQPENMGAGFNWNYVSHVATGKYFKWASSNDRCGDTFIEKCLTALKADPNAVLAYPRTVLIDDNDAVLEQYDGDLAYVYPTASQRFIDVATKMGLNNAMCGLIRRDILRKTPGDRGYPAGDYVLMAELALYGTFRLVPDYLFYRRMDRASSARYLTKEELAHFLRPKGGVTRLPKWRRFGDYYSTLIRTPVGMGNRLRAIGKVTRMMIWDHHALFGELVEYLSHRR